MAGRFFSHLFGCFSNGSRSDENQSDQDQWEEQLASHLYGQYSMASAQANVENEDRFQLKSGPLSNLPDGPTGVFVGIYDGHGGDFCSQYIYCKLFNTLKSTTSYHHGHVDQLYPYVIEQAYHFIEHNFMALAKSNWKKRHYLATVGSCCLTGVVHGNNLYVANAGDSRAVLARWADGDEQPQVVQLSTDHNANDEAIRHEVQAEHPGDPNLFSNVHGSYRLKGTLQVTRAIGDVYLKSNYFNRAPLKVQYRQQQSIGRPFLKFEPTVKTHPLGPNDRFVIFGSDGLWEQLTNQQAVSAVKSSSRFAAAEALLQAALQRASQRNNMTYEELINLPLANKRAHHDDISIVILYFDRFALPNQ